MRMDTPRAAILGLALVTAAGFGGCAANERPIETVRESADHHLWLEHFDEAAVEYQEIADRSPGDWEAQFALGMCRLKLHQLPAARTALEVAHTHRPSDLRIVEALAEVMYQQDDQNQLYAFLRERALTTQSPTIYLFLAKYSIELGDADTAKTAVETAIELDSGVSVEPYLLASSCAQRSGDLTLAVRRLRQAYWINPTDPRVSSRLRELGEVPGPTLAIEPGR